MLGAGNQVIQTVPALKDFTVEQETQTRGTAVARHVTVLTEVCTSRCSGKSSVISRAVGDSRVKDAG